MAGKKTPQLSWSRVAGSSQVACSVCNQLSDTPILGNIHFATVHPEKLCKSMTTPPPQASRSCRDSTPRADAKNAKAKAKP